jgi:precorrin-6A synthase
VTRSGDVRRVHLIGVGPGDPDQVTMEALRAIREVDYFVVTDKAGAGSRGDGAADPLAAARERLLARHLDRDPAVVRVADPERERRPDRTASTGDYSASVAAWHDARAAAYEEVLRSRDGDAGFLVWGDPAFYDSTLRVLQRVHDRGRVALDLRVVPGVSSVQLLAARHRIALHEVGRPLHVTTGRRLREAIASGQDNIVVMLNRTVDLAELQGWWIWWGGNLGTPDEELVAGPAEEVHERIEAARDRLRRRAGWVMDIYLLRQGADG